MRQPLRPDPFPVRQLPRAVVRPADAAPGATAVLREDLAGEEVSRNPPAVALPPTRVHQALRVRVRGGLILHPVANQLEDRWLEHDVTLTGVG
jgi:hypothetical protein